MAGGLTHVYMGVESGDAASLVRMDKKLRPETHLRAGRILRSLDLSFDFGFMLMDPWSTFESVRNNIAFLDTFVGDGWSVAPFCRMLPYAGTEVRRQLEAEGRLLGTPFDPDYSFLDPRLDLFYDWMLATFHTRNFTTEGLCHQLRYSLFESHLRLPAVRRPTPLERAAVQGLAAVCNRQACRTLTSALDYVEARPIEELTRDREFLHGLTAIELEQEQWLSSELSAYRCRVDDRNDAPIEAGLDRSWTLATQDLQAAGISTA